MNKQVSSAAREARRVLRLAPTGSLATLGEDGAPFASLVTVATTAQGEPVLLLSSLAVHTRNLSRDSRASLLLVGPGGEGGDPLSGGRVTLVGVVVDDDDPDLRRRFLARHREAAGYADFGDFGFRRFKVDKGHLVAGFGRIVDLDRGELLTDCTGADDLLAAEESAIAHMNADHGEALRLYAKRLLNMPDGPWTLTGVDPDGIDMRADGLRARLVFETPVTTAARLRRTLADLARSARG